MSGDAGGQIPRGGAGQGIKTELPCLGNRHRDRPVFKGVGGIEAVILDIETFQSQFPSQVIRLNQRGKAGTHVNLGFFRRK